MWFKNSRCEPAMFHIGFNLLSVQIGRIVKGEAQRSPLDISECWKWVVWKG